MAFEYWTSACFVCGRENEGGLKARVVAGELGGLVQATLPSTLVGLPGIGHGGAVVALLDEAMWYAVYGQAGMVSVTAHLEVRFVRPAPPQVPLVAVARLAPGRGAPEGDDSQGRVGARRIGRAVARLLDGSGRLIAAARGRFVEVSPSTIPVHRVLSHRGLMPDTLAELLRWPGVGAFLKGGD